MACTCTGKSLKIAPTNEPSNYLPYDEERDWWTAEIDGEQPLQAAEEGIASYIQTPVTTLCTLFARAATVHGRKPALRVEALALVTPEGDDDDVLSVPKKALETINTPRYIALKRWKSFTWSEYYDMSQKFALALLYLGIEKHSRTGILASNHPYFAVSFMGAILCGGVSVPLDPKDQDRDALAKLQLVRPRVLVIDNFDKLELIRTNTDVFDNLVVIVTWGLPKIGNIKRSNDTEILVYPFNELLNLSTNINIEILNKATKEVLTQNCCAILFTSGVVDDPKPVMLSHDNFHYSAVVNFRMMNNIGQTKKLYKFFSYLPLSVVSFLLYDVIAPIVLTANLSLRGWGTTHFARKDDLDNGALLYRVRAVRPVLFVGTPRVWTDLMNAIETGIETRSNFYKSLLEKSQKRAVKLKNARIVGTKDKPPCFIFPKKFLNRFHKYLGLNKAMFLLCKHGALPLRCSDFFDSLNLRVNEAYGLTETTGLGFMSTTSCFFPGSSGYESPGMETKIITTAQTEANLCNDLFAPAQDAQGEILIRGRGIMMGYFNDVQANTTSFDTNGFFHTGDIGTKNHLLMTKIVGRLEEMVHGVAPETIEYFLKQMNNTICDAVVVSHKRKVNVLLLTLKVNSDEPSDHQVQELRDIIDLTNSTTEVIKSENQKIHKFTILPRTFSVRTGELSSNLKLKRKTILEVYEPIILAMYNEPDFYVPYETAPTADLVPGSEASINPWSMANDSRTVFAASSQFSKLF